MTTARRTRAGIAAVCATALVLTTPVVLAAGPANATNGTPRAGGSLVLIGGKLAENEQILSEIVRLASTSGSDRPVIALVTAAAAPAETADEASADAENNATANGLYYGQLFAAYGADTYSVPVDTSDGVEFEGDTYSAARADDLAVAAAVRAADGVFFGGGDQMDYVRTLLHCTTDGVQDEAVTQCTDSPVLAAVREVIGRGGVVSGVSAGTTIQQGPTMVTGGESYEAWRDGATPGYLDDPDALAYLPYGGFDFFTPGLLDSHFATWGRQGRMIKLALQTDEQTAFGVDETTALVVEGVGTRKQTGRVIGDNGVSILRTDRAHVRRDGTTVRDVRWTYLTDGDRYDFRTERVRKVEGAQRVQRSGWTVDPVTDIWSSPNGDSTYDMVVQAEALVQSRAWTASGTTLETDPTYRVTLRKSVGTDAWTNPNGRISFTDLRVDVSPA